jgi:hypothetical protein
MTNLDMLIKQLEQQWNVSPVEACKRLIGAMGKAINTPLGAIKMGSGLLKDNAESVQVQQWADKCHQQSLYWQDNHQKILKHCLDQSATSCQCVLQDIENLFIDSSDLLAQGKQISVEEKLVNLHNTLLQQLIILSQIHIQLQAQDLAWLLPHVASRVED